MKETPIHFSSEPTPLVVVEGFLSSTGSVGWAVLESQLNGYKKHLADRHVLMASVGPVSSLHDRACELYFAIKGGTVDYGEEHARQFGHARNGRTHSTGLYPEWSKARPLHFLGHSMGGPTIIKLSSLLAQGFFGQHAHPDMILSVTTVSAPFRGTQLVYTLGERTDGAPAVRPYSIGAALAKAVHVLSYLSPVLPKAFDMHTDARSLNFREIPFLSFLSQLRKSDWAESRDAAPYDVTFESVEERELNEEGLCNPSTYYRSYVASVTKPISAEGHTHTPHISQLLMPPLYLSSRSIGSFDFTTLRPSPSFFPHFLPSDDPESGLPTVSQRNLGEEYWANDCVVPVFSQWHPRECSSTRCIHYDSSDAEAHHSPDANITSDRGRLASGIWHVLSLPEAHHLSVLPLWLGTARQQKFWKELHDFLFIIDEQQRPKPY